MINVISNSLLHMSHQFIIVLVLWTDDDDDDDADNSTEFKHRADIGQSGEGLVCNFRSVAIPISTYPYLRYCLFQQNSLQVRFNDLIVHSLMRYVHSRAGTILTVEKN